MSTEQSQPNPLLLLISLGKEARNASTLDELGFMLVNDSRALSVYRQALLWSAGRGVTHLSGVVMPERHSPFMQWALRLCEHLSGKPDLAFKTLSVVDLPEPVGPVTRMMPFGLAMRSRMRFSFAGSRPRLEKSNRCWPRSRRLTFSP